MNERAELPPLTAKVRLRLFSKLLALAVCLSVCVAAAFKTSHAQREEPARPADLYRAVDAQIKALRAADAADAQASEDALLQRSDERFARLRGVDLQSVRAVEFGAVRQSGDLAEVHVFLIRRDAKVLSCAFDLVRDADGWKVNDARFLRGNDADSATQSLQI